MRFACLAGAIVALTGWSTDARANENLAFEAAKTTLDPHGIWIEVGGHGPAWRPSRVPQGWRPYTLGHWEQHPEDLWRWKSDFAWGQIPFHYGRWLQIESLGWVWIFDSVWAPAWVVWSNVGDQVAWAALPPGPTWDGNRFVGQVPSTAWVFAPRSAFQAPPVAQSQPLEGPAPQPVEEPARQPVNSAAAWIGGFGPYRPLGPAWSVAVYNRAWSRSYWYGPRQYRKRHGPRRVYRPYKHPQRKLHRGRQRVGTPRRSRVIKTNPRRVAPRAAPRLPRRVATPSGLRRAKARTRGVIRRR